MRAVTGQQVAIMELASQGLDPEQIVSRLGTPAGVVRAQLTRLTRKVRAGAVVPPPLPIDSVARRKRIYLAGFDVFRVDAVEHGKRLRMLCSSNGFDAIYPLDHEVPNDLPPAGQARWIYRANIEAIDAADIVMANLDDFRGPGEPDSGTAFEIGYAVARGKSVRAYTSHTSLLVERVPCEKGGHAQLCERGFAVEDYGLRHNLMLACSARIVVGGPAQCLADLVAMMNAGTTPSP
ncbi:nucleoside 2-deoxyribosyltransferase (plasmid) [Paraburkholderia acidicola]|uniref:Nucleoside 2-deoxyribosyltransferase n=1 Tax=Paraburkholderia acidicola TaxID=1912599 RepID=A0ABV1LZS2_9BURK